MDEDAPPSGTEETTGASDPDLAPDPGHEPLAAPGSDTGPRSGTPPEVDRPTRRSGYRESRPWEALERLDRQWADHTPIAQVDGPIATLALTTADDPRGWDYLAALMGAGPRETAAACAAWLEAQLAADAVALGRAIRPRVELVPSGRLWHVVRTVADLIIVIDGPGFLTPLAAAIAASRRYHAELLRALEPLDDADTRAQEPDDGSRSGTDAAPTDSNPATPSPAGPEDLQ
jgi:hypothetical protein